jgi:thymidylate synthase
MYVFSTELRSIVDPFKEMFAEIQDHLLRTKPINVGEWQSQAISTPMRELLGVICSYAIPSTASALARETGAHLPWAEDHFQERVGGVPLNPAPSEAWWPFASKAAEGTNIAHKSENQAFSHTYPERMWASRAHGDEMHSDYSTRAFFSGMEDVIAPYGLRFEYGDLEDLVKALINSPMTRQAFLPIWFPEDLKAVTLGKRVPCTLGYHFIIRHNKLHMTYFMRSTDLLRHFQDDIYMAGRLAQWVCEKFNDAQEVPALSTGTLTFHTANMHIFDADVQAINYRKTQGLVWAE